MGFPRSEPVELDKDGVDLTTTQGRNFVDRKIEADDPYCITFAFMCGIWSPWQNMTMANTEGRE